MKKIAILLTCFNRKEKTVACLKNIFGQKSIEETAVKVFLVDDGSTDGTGDAVRSQFPQVQVIQGSGSLFWNGGMRVAYGEALQAKFDYYLWINDDTMIFEDTLSLALGTAERLKGDGVESFILTGSTKDAQTGETTYGGLKIKKGIHPFKFDLIEPDTELISCDTVHGNFTLISASAADHLGNIDPNYTHAFGDFDYGFRAVKASIPCFLLPGYIGTCSENSLDGTWQDKSLSFKERLKRRHSFKGVPFRNWSYFCKAHGGLLWPLWVISPYVKMFMQSILKR